MELLPFEAKMLRHLSSQFADEKVEAKRPDKPMPYNMDRDTIAANRRSVSDKIGTLFGG